MTALKIVFNNDDVFYANLEFSSTVVESTNEPENQICLDHFDEQFLLILNSFDVSGNLSSEYKKYDDKMFFFKSFMQDLKKAQDEFLDINLYSLNKKVGQKKKVLITDQSVYDLKYIIKTSDNFLIFTNYN
jgi:hypothetical protein